MNVFDGGSFGLLSEIKEKFIAIEFDTFKEDKYGDMNDDHVDVGSLISVQSRNLSSVKLIKAEKDVVVVGLSASINNSSQTYNLYSEPLDPDSYNDKKAYTSLDKKSRASNVLGALIFGTGCGALGAFVVMFMWTIFAVVLEDYALAAKETGRQNVISYSSRSGHQR
ncbi:hypothetical protein LIER_38721 [Lithospermum erythrorhizon]|uniref:Legume lectin domain-containing protein n=1 Tax=Lithospermum erythrorhizon TaxID=34254 RepID=A0AAV3Q3V4_LITER